MVTAYTLAFGGLLLLGGRIADYVGRKRMFVIGLLGFAPASALGGAAVNAPMLFGARALQGAFAAMLAPAALSLITVTFTEVKERATAFGVYGAIAGGGAAIGLIMGGVLTQYASWRWCLLVNVPIALVTAVAAVRWSARVGPTATPATTSPAPSRRPPAWCPWSTASPRPPDGWSAPATLASWSLAVVCWSRSWPSSPGPATRSCRMRVVLDRNRGGSFLASLLIGCRPVRHVPLPDLLLPGYLGYSALKPASPSCPSPPASSSPPAPPRS